MPAGGELAALFARRAKVGDNDFAACDDAVVAKEEKVQQPAAPHAPRPPPATPPTAPTTTISSRNNSSLLLPPRSSPPSTPVRPPPMPSTPNQPVDEIQPVKITTPFTDEESQAKFESRNLEVGIPTPSFLMDVRANLKKPGQKTITNSGYSSDSDARHEKQAEKAAPSSGGLHVKSNSFTIAGPSPKNLAGGSEAANKKYEKGAMARHVKSNSFQNTSSLRSASTGSSSTDADNNIKKSNSFASRAQDKRNQIRAAASTCSSSYSNNDVPEDEQGLPGAASAAAASAIVTNVSKNHVRSNSESSAVASSKSDVLAARRSRMVASKRSSSSVLSSSSRSNNNETNETTPTVKASPKASPAHLRREKLLARVRASHTATTKSTDSDKNKNNNPKQQHTVNTNAAVDTSFDSTKTSIISPKRDEFEVLFADTDVPEFDINNAHVDSKGSIDSISNEMLLNHAALNSTSTAGSSTTVPTANIKPKVNNKDKVSNRSKKKGGTPTKVREESRLHNASTPKIRGNSNYRRENYHENSVQEMEIIGENNQIKSVPSMSGSGTNQSALGQQHGNTMPTFQQHQQQQQQQQIDLPQELQSTPRRLSDRLSDIPQAYPLRQSPSQMSQMSGITTPSCFPQEFHVPASTTLGHLQQPMLVGGPIQEIYEIASTDSSPHVAEGSNVGAASGGGGGQKQQQQQQQPMVGSTSGAFSSGMEAENRRLRDQLTSVAKKLEEKDAIISQLMKRIGDLETMNSRSNSSQVVNATSSFGMESHHSSQQHNLAVTPSSVSTSLHSAGGRTSNSDSYALSTMWDTSQPHAFPNAFSSQDTESAFSSSMPSFSPRGHTSQQQQPPKRLSKSQRSRSGSGGVGNSSSSLSKASPNTTTTSSTASVTTANSSKSGRHSRSRSEASPRSHKQKVKNDDRKFVC